MEPKKDQESDKHETLAMPFVSVVLPVRNEANRITHILSAILNQDYPKERMEILVVDGMSDDGTQQAIRTLACRDSRLRLVENPRQIVAPGLNLGIRLSRGDIVIRVDGHTEIADDYVRQCVAALKRTGADNVGGRMSAIGSGSFGQAVALATSTWFGVGGSRFHYSDREELVDTVYLGAWPREVFRHAGLFDEELVRNQDDEFNYRLNEQGGKVLLSPRIKSLYTVRSTAVGLWRQYWGYGFWKVRVCQKHPSQMRLSHFAPASFVLVLFLALLFSVLAPIAGKLLAVAVLIYSLSALAVSLVSARNPKQFALLFCVYPLLHFAYGLGFLAGLVRFAGRWHDRSGDVPAFEG